MKKIEIKLTGLYDTFNPVVTIDNQVMRVKKNKFGNMICVFETEKNTVKIKVNTFLDIGGIAWFFIQIFFFLISIFGLFDLHRKEKCRIVDFEMDVDLKEENKIKLQFNPQKENNRAIHIQTDLVSREVINTYDLDTLAKKKLRCLKWVKIVVAIIMIVAAAILLWMKF